MESEHSSHDGDEKSKTYRTSKWCSAINCTNSKMECPDLAFFSFPLDPERSRRWVISSRRADLEKKAPKKLNRNNVICEVHFEQCCFKETKGRKLLKKDAVPTLFAILSPKAAKKKKKFISKKEATTYQLIPGYEEDEEETTPLPKSEDAPKDIFYDDEYNYLKHLRSVGEKATLVNVESFKIDDETLSQYTTRSTAPLPFREFFSTDETEEEKIDPEILAAPVMKIEADDTIEDGDDFLDDDFVAAAGGAIPIVKKEIDEHDEEDEGRSLLEVLDDKSDRPKVDPKKYLYEDVDEFEWKDAPPSKPKFDCVSILSLNSNTKNLPTDLIPPKKEKSSRMPSVSETSEVNVRPGLTLSELEIEMRESRRADKASTFRPKDETVEEKKARKNALKDERTFEKMLQSNRKNASSIWSIMTKTSRDIAKCNLCGQEFKCAKGTSNMLRHVKGKHPVVIQGTEVTEEARAESSEEAGPSVQSLQSTQQSITASINKLTKYRAESEKKKALDNKLLAMVYTDMQPFSIVEDDGFRCFCKEMDARYELPSRRQLKRALPKVYGHVKEQLIETLSKVDAVAITTDLWTSINMESFLTITAHFLEPPPSWKLQSTVLATRLLDKSMLGSSAEGMAEVMQDVLTDFKIKDKIVAATTDNASAMVNLVRDHLKVLHVRCFAHTLNLIVKNAMKASAEVQALVEKVKAIVTFFHRSAKATAALKSAQHEKGIINALKLSQEVETRWKSTLKMMRRYSELHSPVSGALMKLGKESMIISDEKVERIKIFMENLEPFDEATELMSTEKTTSLSNVLVVVRQLQHFLENETTQTNLSDNLLKEISVQFPNPEESFPGAAATLLDPRFKRIPFSNEELRNQHEETIVGMMQPLFTTARSQDETDDSEAEMATPPPAKKSLMASFVERVKQLEKAAPETLTGRRAELQRYM